MKKKCLEQMFSAVIIKSKVDKERYYNKQKITKLYISNYLYFR